MSDTDKAAILAAMKEVRAEGLAAARHLEGDIYEVRASGDRVTYRILFAAEGEHDQVLLALEGISKKQQKTPKSAIDVANRRLRRLVSPQPRKHRPADSGRSRTDAAQADGA